MQPETPQTQPQQTTPQTPFTSPEPPAPVSPLSEFSGMFQRRISRMGFFLGFVYWQLLLLLPVAGISAAILMLNGGVPSSLVDFYGSSAATFLGYFFGLVAVVSLPISLSLYIRRLHDLGQAGWWSILSLIAPINFFFMLYLLFAKGSPEENAYGKPVRSNAFLAVLGFSKPRE